jgi:aldose 1-epimerase
MTVAAHRSVFGSHEDGTEVAQFRLQHGPLSVDIIEYGARLQQIYWHHDSGHVQKLIWGLEDLPSYERDEQYLGAVIGPVANRLENATYSDGQSMIAVEPNWGCHQLHGGAQGLHQQTWRGQLVSDDRGPALELTTTHADGTDGYPGNLFVKAKYVLAECGQLCIELLAHCDQRRIVSLTAHPYFQLSETGDDQRLSIFSERYLAVDKSQIPTGQIQSSRELFGRPCSAQRVTGLSLDHTFIFDGERKSALAELQSEALRLQVFANQPALQVYTAREKTQGTAVCFEPHGFVNAPNRQDFPSIMLAPGQRYDNQICYVFGEVPSR